MNRKIDKKTRFGPIVIIWAIVSGVPKIRRILLSTPERSAIESLEESCQDLRASSCPEIEDVANGIQSFLEGDKCRFSLSAADLTICSEFQRRVLVAEHKIPRGKVSTYRLIAEQLGKDGGARAVGNALANNPFPLIVPCHRAIRSDRRLGGYQGGLEMKRALLEAEGVVLDETGKAAIGRFFYERKSK